MIYNKFGYTLKLLSKDDGREIFKYLANYRITEDMSAEERYERRAKIKNQIINELDIEYHFPIGLYENDILIGVCFTELYNDGKLAKISYIKINQDKHETILPHILFNFLMNELYKDIRITFKNNMLNHFDVDVRVYPKIINVSSFENKYKKRIKKYFEEH